MSNFSFIRCILPVLLGKPTIKDKCINKQVSLLIHQEEKNMRSIMFNKFTFNHDNLKAH